MVDDQAGRPIEKVQRAHERGRRERESRALRPVAVDTASVEARDVPNVRRAIPQGQLSERIVAGLDGVKLADAFRMLRIQVVQRLREVEGSTLAVTSPLAGEGKTLISCNLAVSLARLSDRGVLLVDLDLRRPSVHSTFGFAPTNGISDHLLRGVPLADCFIDPGIDRLLVLPGGAPLPNSSELLSSAQMSKLTAELEDSYADRIVVYDLPPVLLADDALVFFEHADAYLLVVEQGRTRREEVARCLELLEKVNVIGTVLNKARGVTQNYGYGY
jgi:protein-tyrosine kinase